MGPLKWWPAGHAIMALSRAPSVERMVYRYLISAGSPHHTARCWSTPARQLRNVIVVSVKQSSLCRLALRGGFRLSFLADICARVVMSGHGPGPLRVPLWLFVSIGRRLDEYPAWSEPDAAYVVAPAWCQDDPHR